MTTQSLLTSPHQNHLLSIFPTEIQSRLFSSLEYVDFRLGHVVCESGESSSHVYFPTDSIVSMLYEMENGSSTEISVIGNEGLVGSHLILGGNSCTSRAIVQSSGSAYRLSAKKMKAEFEGNAEVSSLILRYIQSLTMQIAQTAVCNRHHCIDQQLCRRLLLSLDRLPGNELNMTQEVIANMLGVRREGITEAAGKLQSQGVIEYSRGHITVLDRSKLEELSCECYAVVKNESDRLGA